jgi:cytochrome c oxidase cbb3-type subunit 3
MDFRAVRTIIAGALVALAACSDRRPETAGDGVARQSSSTPAPLAVRYSQHIAAGGAPAPGDSLRNPYDGDQKSATEGEKLFSSMNCDGCHGGGAVGFVGPSLSDGRWRYGGSDGAIFQSIHSGRPKGMPAFGGLLSPEIIWKLVTYLQSLPVPKSVPTQAW